MLAHVRLGSAPSFETVIGYGRRAQGQRPAPLVLG